MFYIYPFLLVLIGLALLAWSAGHTKATGVSLDLGVVFVTILLVYGFVPGVGLLLAHQGVGQIIDQRLSSGFDVANVEDVQWMHLLLVLGFMLSYFAKSKKTEIKLRAGFFFRCKSAGQTLGSFVHHSHCSAHTHRTSLGWGG